MKSLLRFPRLGLQNRFVSHGGRRKEAGGRRNSAFLFPSFILPPAALILFFIAAPAFAQVTVVENEENDLKIYRMLVSPAAEPEPAFRYRLLKHEDDRKEGNAAPYYYRAQFDLDRVSKAVRKEFGEEYDTWYSTNLPLVDLPQDDVRKALSKFDGSIMKGLREATARRYCDWGWEMQNVRGMNLFSFHLQEIQESRELARMLALQTRLSLAEGRIDDVVDYLQMTYQLGRDVGKPPYLVCGLVGIAISGISNAHTLELMATPDAPNLYWAFAELPKPLIDLRRAARFELGIGPRVFPLLRDAETSDRSPQEWSRYIGDAFMLLLNDLGVGISLPDELRFGLRGPEWDSAGAKLIGTATGLWSYTRAKAELIASGMSAEAVEAMPAGQAIVLQASRAYRHTSQEMEKLWYMSFPEMKRREDAIEEGLQRDGYLVGILQSKEILPIASLLLPAINAARISQERLSRDLAAMQVIEALRMHAAEAGEFPAALESVTIVPVPKNPATGQAFVYHTRRVDGRRTAILELPDTDGFPGYNRRYEITLRAAEKKETADDR